MTQLGSASPRAATIGVVIPAYAPRPGHLERALESVQAQTYPDWTCVIVDDGSTVPLAHDLLPRDHGFELVRKANGGVASARNAGAARLDTEFLAFLDQDDEWLPHKLERQLEFMRVRQLDMSDTSFEFVLQGTHRSEGFEHHHGDLLRLLVRGRMGLSTLMVCRRVFDEINGFDERLRVAPDWDFQLRAAARGARFDRVDEILCLIHIHGANASRDYRRMYSEQMKVLRRYRLSRQREVRTAAASGRRFMRKSHAYHAIDVFRTTRSINDLVWAVQRDPVVVARAVARKLVRPRSPAA